MTKTISESDDEREVELEGQNFRDVLLNGDEKFNRFVKMTDTRFQSAARRQNKARQESREDFEKLRRDLEPFIALGRALLTLKDLAPIFSVISAVIGGAVTLILFAGWPI